jgi:hypothetical protein
MKKLLMKPVGGCISPNKNDSVCSSHMNTSKYIQWMPKDYDNDVDIEMYIDEGILDGLNNDKQKYGWLLESRQYNLHIIDHIIKNMNLYKQHYKYIFTCQRYLVNIGLPFTYAISNAAPWTMVENRKKFIKNKLTSMLVSSATILPGHKYRVNYHNNNVQHFDSYGKGHNEIINTDDAYKDYMFTVSMENDISDAYFTERLTSPMTTYTVPIYRGSKYVVENYFNPKGILWENEIDLKDLTPQLYESMLPYLKENYEIACNWQVADDYIAQKYFL